MTRLQSSLDVKAAEYDAANQSEKAQRQLHSDELGEALCFVLFP